MRTTITIDDRLLGEVRTRAAALHRTVSHEDAPRHAEYRDWLESAVNAVEPFGLASIVARGFLRVATHPRIPTTPIDTEAALDLLDGLHNAPAVVQLEPGREHSADRGFARFPGLRARHPLDP